MRKILKNLLLFLAVSTVFASCGKTEEHILTEKSFFLVMTNIQLFPHKYVGEQYELDCFTYKITDTSGKEYYCGVRKCSSGYGCTCGKDTIIGFILDYDGEIPEPKNQSEDSNDKTWVHLCGSLETDAYTDVTVYAYNGEEPDYAATETIRFLTFRVETLTEITDYSGLNYYVTK